MGNSHTKESRDPNSPLSPHDPRAHGSNNHVYGSSSGRHRARSSRSDLGGIFGIGGASSSQQPPYERRETKQEREARRLERERQARLIERERSLKEEHIDGGYLVTLGTYIGPEDFSKSVVRQLQIERRLAPFWRGLNDFSETWTEYQIVAAARGLPLPDADAIPPDDLIPRPVSAAASTAVSPPNIDSLMVPMGGRTQSAASDRSGAVLGSSLPSGGKNSSPFKHRSKGIAAALSLSSRNNSTTDVAVREIKLPHDPFVNGQPMEVFLYKDGSECPICFLYYPPYLNHTRCCDQPICSECFVQIKRADPHYPEGHGDSNGAERPPEEQAGLLISEPACCPYCQQPDFGVTYEPPPFRRGLAYSSPGPHMGAMGTAMSSSSSLNSNLSPTSVTSPTSAAHGRRRTQSLSANAPNVITTDRVRPDWATKLATQRAHIARRAAAATALHTAAFLVGNTENQRPHRISRFSRRNTAERTTAGSSGGELPQDRASAGASANTTAAPGQSGSASPAVGEAGAGPGRAVPGARRSRMEDLEDMMFAEAIRLSLAAEEERKRKAEKEERKEAKRREKEEKKAAKAAAKNSGSADLYGGSSGHSSVSGSTLSLPSLGLGRRRGNSAASNLRVEASVASAMAATTSGGPGAPPAPASPANTGSDKGKGVDRPAKSVGEAASSEGDQASVSSSSSSVPSTASQPIPASQHRPAGPSHLRHISNASSATNSSYTDTPGGSYTGKSPLNDPRASGASLGAHGNHSDDSGHVQADSDETEPMFNFKNLAEMVGVELEGENAGRRLSAISRDATADAPSNDAKPDEHPQVQHLEHAATDATGTNAVNDTTSTTPALMVTPGTPALEKDGFEDSKQLGFTATTTARADQQEQQSHSA